MYTEGMSSRVSPLTRDLLQSDSRPLPPGLELVGNHVPEIRPIPFSRYTDPEFAKLEMDRLWTKTWQYVCRTEDLPQIGDRLPYDVGSSLSLFIVRSGSDEFKAFHNACRHRGTRLVNTAASGSIIKCPFHGWQWKNNGTLDKVPCQWDFEGSVTVGSHSLREVKLAVWQGFIFVNPDPNAGPLEDSLGMLPKFFEGRNGYSERYTYAHAVKKVRANWKAVLEAFLEAYHVVEAHYDSLPYAGDAASALDVWDTGAGQVSRVITPNAVPSPHLGDNASIKEAIEGAARKFAPPGTSIPTFDTATGEGRAQLAEWRRGLLKQASGRDFSMHTDSEMLDSTQFYMFPNFGPWFGEGLPLLYQFLPYGDNPNESIFTVRMTRPVPLDRPRPAPAKIVYLDFDESLTGNALDFGDRMNHVFDQDFANLPYIQKGMRSAPSDAARPTLGRYQEKRIQHFHNVLEKTLGIV